MKIVIDARCLSSTPRGIGQFLVNALCALAADKPDWELVVCSNKPLHDEALVKLEKFGNISYQIENYNRAIVWFLLHLPRVLKKIKPDYVWYPAAMGLPVKTKDVKVLATVHDVVSIEYKDTMSWKNRIASKIFFDRTVNNADVLWCVSNYTKQMVEKYFPKRKAKNIVVGSSIDTNFFKRLDLTTEQKQQIRSDNNISEGSKMLLFVGTLEPRKNLKFLLSLMPKLAARNYELLIVGGKGWGKTDIAQIVEADDYPKSSVHFAGYVTNDQLREIYNTCDCYVSTSLNEGFGMPQLEAIFCGAPVVTANNSAMSEVVAGAGILVDGWDVDIWFEAIKNATTQNIDPTSKIEEYDWSRIAQLITKNL